MNEWASRVGGVLAGIVAAAIMAGLLFYQCVYPFINDSSETWTCADEEVQDFCDDPFTIGGFIAAICGRDEVKYKGSVIESVTLSGGFGEDEPDTYELEMACPGVSLKWEYESLREFEASEYVTEQGAANDQTRLAVRLLAEYSYGDIDIATARRLLVDE
ncbi:MAG: hypothetical protein WD379_08930 [Dehalococcoidia bacterium]